MQSDIRHGHLELEANSSSCLPLTAKDVFYTGPETAGNRKAVEEDEVSGAHICHLQTPLMDIKAPLMNYKS